MIALNELTGISESKRNAIVECLDDLLICKNKASIISGYNWYNKTTNSNRIITFSNIHESKDYLEDMLKDLSLKGYKSESILENIREKAGAFIWRHSYITADERGNPLRIKIKDIRNGEYIPLSKYLMPLKNYSELNDKEGHLIAESTGWELNLGFEDKYELIGMVNLFTNKSSKLLYDAAGNEIGENFNHWRDAYYTPVLILGEKAVHYASELPQFDIAAKIELKENRNEISFIIHNNLDLLKSLPNYNRLIKLGFIENKCLANKPFLMDVDLIR